jgi:5-methylcytosine-specific restriction endonuclease McrA
MTTLGTGKYSVAEDSKPCAHCGEMYHGTARSKYCSIRCKEAKKHADRMADPERRVVAQARRAKARATYNEKNPAKYTPVAELSPKALTAKRQRVRRYRARKAEALHIPYTHEQLTARIAYWGNLCWICRTAPWTAMDHVKPLAAGGADILSNLRPVCGPCNTRKKDRWPYNPESPRTH